MLKALKAFGFMILTGIAIASGGCETVKGVGKDITNASQTVQDQF